MYQEKIRCRDQIAKELDNIKSSCRELENLCRDEQSCFNLFEEHIFRQNNLKKDVFSAESYRDMISLVTALLAYMTCEEEEKEIFKKAYMRMHLMIIDLQDTVES